MRTHVFIIFFFFFLFFVTLTPKSSLASKTSHKMPNNETIYEDSKQLCQGCTKESLEFLFHHNLVRAAKGELPLKWDPQLEEHAKWWAGQRQADCKLENSFSENEAKWGENLFMGTGSSWTPTDAVSIWADEEKYYTYATNTCNEGQMCGHYTQIVWKTTEKLGCARVGCDKDGVFMTCNYDPPGNYIGDKPY